MHMDKGLTPTMGLMSKESHPLCIKSQLAGGSTQNLDDMNFDIDNEAFSYSQAFDPFSSPPKPPMMDTVDWASSQPVALKSLLSEVTKKPEKRSINYEPTWPASDGFFNQSASTSRAPLEPKSRPLRRTNSNARARLGPEAVSVSSKPPPAPDGAFWGNDRLAVLAACQNVSERMNENAFALAAQAYNTAPPKLPSKRKPRDPHLAGIPKTRRASTSHSVTREREGVDRLEKGKQRASLLPQAVHFGADYQRSTSVPLMARSLQRVASSSSASSELPDTSTMDIDTDFHDETPPTSLPVSPSILPIKQPPQSVRSIFTSSPAPASQPRIQLHPLLSQKPQPKNSTTTRIPPALSHQDPKPPPPQAPLLSQSTRPPLLGMRRAHTAPVAMTHVLPTKQKAFKPPLLSQPACPTKGNLAPAPGIGTEANPKTRLPEHQFELGREPESDANLDADSSFGDISLGLDDEELEMTMRQYD